MQNRQLTPMLAGQITRLLLEFDALNRKRQLVNDLIEIGVTQEMYHEWRLLHHSVVLGVQEPLVVDVTNLLRSINKGTQPHSEELVQRTDLSIRQAEQRSIQAQKLVLETSQAPKQQANGVLPPENDPVKDGQSAPTFNVRLEAGAFILHGNPEFNEAMRLAKTLQQGQHTLVTIDRAGLYTTSAAEPTRYGACVSNGDGTAEFLQKEFPASREPLTSADIAELHQSATKSKVNREEKIVAANNVRLDLVESKKLRMGNEWAGAQTYVEGKTGLTTFSKSKITNISAEGFLTVQSTLRGSNRLYVFTVDANSRLFDNYPTLESVLSQQEKGKIADQAGEVKPGIRNRMS